jgi:hypothetical protein
VIIFACFSSGTNWHGVNVCGSPWRSGLGCTYVETCGILPYRAQPPPAPDRHFLATGVRVSSRFLSVVPFTNGDAATRCCVSGTNFLWPMLIIYERHVYLDLDLEQSMAMMWSFACVVSKLQKTQSHDPYPLPRLTSREYVKKKLQEANQA